MLTKNKPKEKPSKGRDFESILKKYVQVNDSKFYTTGSLVLDAVLSNGKGIPIHNIVEVFSSQGLGKCVSLDTFVFTDKGLIKIGDLSDNRSSDTFHPMEIGVYSLSGQQLSSHFYFGGKKPLIKMVTSKGYEIKGTFEHPVLVLNPDYSFEFIKLGDLINHDNMLIPIVSPRIFPAFNYKITPVLDSLGELVGFMVSDSYIKEYMNEDNLPLNFIPDSIGLYGFGSFSIGSFNMGEFSYDLFEIFGIQNINSENKEVPKFILQSPKEIQLAFLRGYFEADGSFSLNKNKSLEKIECCSRSKMFVHQLQLMLLNFGIISLRGECSGKDKNDKHNCYKNCYKNCYNCNGWYLSVNEISNLNRFCNQIGFISEGKMRKQDLNQLQNFHAIDNYQGGIFFDTIKSINQIDDDFVADLTVPSSHSFVSNGIMSHNSTLALSVSKHIYNAYGKKTLYLDVEKGGINESLISSMGINREGIDLLQVSYYNEAEEILSSYVNSPEDIYGLCVIDSETALMPEKMFTKSVEDIEPGLKARCASPFMQKLRIWARAKEWAFILIDQIRVKISFIGPSIEDSASAYAVKFFTDIRLALKDRGNIEYTKYKVGKHIELVTVKNRWACPYVPYDLYILFGKGISNIWSVIHFLMNRANGEIIQSNAIFKINLPGLEQNVLGKESLYDLISSNYQKVLEYFNSKYSFNS